MDILWLILTVAGFAAVPGMALAWVTGRWQSRRRNASGACASCGHNWAEVESDERFLIHGRLVCEGCAMRARKRLGWQFAFLSGWTLFAVVMILVMEGVDLLALMPPTTVAAMALGAVGLMKLANRRAQQEIATGSYPFLLSPGEALFGEEEDFE
ncbi:MAG: hypothetical protein HKO65_05540 [Gemmatimonadetes bacterium]|nr:hypothetical protein [Gemmatimonadota bacterium]